MPSQQNDLLVLGMEPNTVYGINCVSTYHPKDRDGQEVRLIFECLSVEQFR